MTKEWTNTPLMTSHCKMGCLSDILINSITDVAISDLWKLLSVPIPKTNPPNFLDDLSPISSTAIPCKNIDRIIVKELWEAFTPKLNHGQIGNIKGSSTDHYRVDLINYITSHVDKRPVESI